jgi:UDP-N-acetylmuramate dehydrogenase
LSEIGEIVRWRRENQPGGRNAGSVFRNPPGDAAGRLIEAAGLKGHRVGSAKVSSKHANFVQADAGGSADDVYRLIGEVERLVLTLVLTLIVTASRLIGAGRSAPLAERQLLVRMRLLRELLLVVAIR